MAMLPVWGIRQLHCSANSMLEEQKRKNKGLVKKGRSGLIESFGPKLHWSERDLLQESGFMVSKQ